MTRSPLTLAASHAGISLEQAGLAVNSALRSLHRIARTDAKGLTAVALETVISFGPEAAYHIFGLVEHDRANHDREIPWSETLERLDPHIKKYRALLDLWAAGDGDPEPI